MSVTWNDTLLNGSEELAESIAPLVTYCIERFGPDRSMFESNFY